ncbi:MAG: hypothetical protein U5R31_05355 [Acidimicrobiia bacterium]|nr:hypothetical protein [Acidimicrobiia bacterium]
MVTDPNERRPLGPVEVAPGQEAGFGLHAIGFELALGNLVSLIEEQTESATR